MRFLRLGMLLVVLAVVGVGITYAKPASDNGIPIFDDGRVNNWQMDEPMAVYCAFDHSEDVNVGIFTGIDVWGLNNSQILQASAAKIAAATFSSKVTSVTLDSENGYSLVELPNQLFTVSAPNGYTFTWSRGDTNC